MLSYNITSLPQARHSSTVSDWTVVDIALTLDGTLQVPVLLVL